MPKKYSIKFWLFFWLASGLFLTGWFLYWNIVNQGLPEAIGRAINFLPIDWQQKREYQALAELGDFFVGKNKKEKTLLVLFQNNLEIRPGGGFLGAFSIVKIKDGNVISMETHDLSDFDTKIPNVLKSPYPIKDILHTEFWKMRDSNFSPDFTENALKAQELYYLGQGTQQFDGVIGITANTLTSMLKATGPVTIEGYPGTYDSENAIIALEYQVEQAFDSQGIPRDQRKSVIDDLAREIEKRIFLLSSYQKIKLAKILIQDLKQKNIQLYFKDAALQKIVENVNWSGEVDRQWTGDYLMSVDANLGAFKSDYYMKRSMDYTVTLAGDNPIAHLKITYEHTARQKDWMTRDYLTYLRVYVPEGSQFISGENFDNPQVGEELGKKYFGAIIKVPIGTTKLVEINYALPGDLAQNSYALEIQKQAGISNEPAAVHIINKSGSKRDYSYIMNSDMQISY